MLVTRMFSLRPRCQPQTAQAAYQQIHLNARLRCPVEQPIILILKRVHLEDQMASLARLGGA
jgi:hypothetical protein